MWYTGLVITAKASYFPRVIPTRAESKASGGGSLIKSRDPHLGEKDIPSKYLLNVLSASSLSYSIRFLDIHNYPISTISFELPSMFIIFHLFQSSSIYFHRIPAVISIIFHVFVLGIPDFFRHAHWPSIVCLHCWISSPKSPADHEWNLNHPGMV